MATKNKTKKRGSSNMSRVDKSKNTKKRGGSSRKQTAISRAPTMVTTQHSWSKPQRDHKGKLRYDLIPADWERALAEVTTHGALVYDENEWKEGSSWSLLYAAARRHLALFQSGENYDSKSNCHHLAHAAWNLLALMYHDVHNIGTPDLQETPGVTKRPARQR